MWKISYWGFFNKGRGKVIFIWTKAELHDTSLNCIPRWLYEYTHLIYVHIWCAYRYGVAITSNDKTYRCMFIQHIEADSKLLLYHKGNCMNFAYDFTEIS